MIEDSLLNYLLFYILLEIYEVQWQKANTLLGMLARMYEHYHKSPFLFLLMHPTLYFAIMFMMLSDYNGYSVALLAIKALDILTKMYLMKQVFIDKELSAELSLALLSPIPKGMVYMGLLIYPPLIYMLFSSPF